MLNTLVILGIASVIGTVLVWVLFALLRKAGFFVQAENQLTLKFVEQRDSIWVVQSIDLASIRAVRASEGLRVGTSGNASRPLSVAAQYAICETRT